MSLLERTIKEFTCSDISDLKRKAWSWSRKFEYTCILENNGINYPHDPFINILAVGTKSLPVSPNDSFESLKVLLEKENDWAFGYFSYDLKNQIEELYSENPDFMEAPELLFFVPETLLFFFPDKISINSVYDPNNLFNEIISHEDSDYLPQPKPDGLSFNGINKKEYLEVISQIKNHLLVGDIYEMNYCIEFSNHNIIIDPLDTFRRLIQKSPMPFSLYLRAGNQNIICASPERFLKKAGDKLISQPIKGTIKRGMDREEDEFLKNKLRTSEKELAENMMIVDIVRNDLAKSSIPGTVIVEELFGIYSFKQLHQMISTISSLKRQDVHYIDAIKNAFPMGSMTGAPKIRAMELIERLELSKRGAFSGAAGYITPLADFDFNVIIRSIFFNSSTNRLSFQVGSAITFDSDPEYEYEECFLKAKAIFEILSGK